ncbi:MAG: RecX family transcriptional regulator, partial [Anaerolineaceae bacterium]|nr:RecX family transcriptional regulator [Anaerolineaceae bacterium]
MIKKITALKIQKRNPNRVNVYLDDEYAFGLAKIVAVWLKIGQELDEVKIATLKAEDEAEVVYQKALHFLSFRPRSEGEVRQRLLKQEYDEAVIDAAIVRLKEKHFLGDQQFASVWIENRSTFRPRSQRMLAMELRKKDVSEEVIASALEEAPEADVLAYQAAERYAHRLKGLDWLSFRKKLL